MPNIAARPQQSKTATRNGQYAARCFLLPNWQSIPRSEMAERSAPVLIGYFDTVEEARQAAFAAFQSEPDYIGCSFDTVPFNYGGNDERA